MADDAELVIAGAGLTGHAARRRLRRRRARRSRSSTRRTRRRCSTQGFDGRTSAIAYGSRLVFDGIGLWPEIAAEAEPIREIRVADDEFAAVPALRHRDLGSGRRRDAARLHRREPGVAPRPARTRPRPADACKLLAPRPHRRDGGEPRPARSRCSVTASGCGRGWSPPPTASNSPLRRAAGIRAIEWRYRQTGIVTTVAHARPHGGIAVEHFLPAGPFAILPMTGAICSSIVWTEDADLAPRLLALPEAAFAAELRARFGDFLGDDRAGRAALVLSARADAGRALCRAAAWRWSARPRMSSTRSPARGSISASATSPPSPS